MTKKTAAIYKQRCVACGACKKVCPRKALSIHRGCYAKVEADLCVGCGICQKTCPANAIEIKNREAVS